jgi:hypothetical protein
MDHERKAHHCLLGAEVVDYEGTANSPRHIEQTAEKSVCGIQYGVTSRSLLDNGCPTKYNTQGGVITDDATAGLNPGSLMRDTCTYVSTTVDEYMPNWKNLRLATSHAGSIVDDLTG